METFAQERTQSLHRGDIVHALANTVVSLRMAAEKGTWADDWPVCGT